MKKIAIIGSGISGLTCAYLLHKKADITVFEKADYIGGHTATIDVEVDSQHFAIDTGFIVFNDRTYPYFEKLLAEIGVQGQKTQMSFSVHNAKTRFEYNGHTVNTLFAQRRNILRPRFWRLLYDIVRFNRLCKARYHAGDYHDEETLGDFLQHHNFNDFFNTHYILPMGAAIWSTSIEEMSQFGIEFFIRFFYNHGLLDLVGRPQWYVIPGGSREYIKPLTEAFKNSIELNSEIQSIRRDAYGVTITFDSTEPRQFDEVIFACHSDQALSLLLDPTEDEKAVLGAIPYTENSVILHTDTNILPKRRSAWASWNYLLNEELDKAAVVTYHMNTLQSLDAATQFCVTLNHKQGIQKNKIIREFSYSHPVFNQKSLAAQAKRGMINGKNHSYFCGAYWYNGFHEDGVRSAVDIAAQFGVEF